MKKLTWCSIFLLILFRIQTQGQHVVSLTSLYDALDTDHPYVKLKGIALAISTQQQQLNNTARLPQTNFAGQATWQSDVTSISIPFPGIEIPTPTKDQYRATLDITQSLWDGGTYRSTKDQINSALVVDQTNTEVLLYNLRESICKAYFGAQMADLTIQQLNILIRDLEDKSHRLTVQIREGIASGYQDAVLKVKVLEAQQAIREAQKQKQAAIHTLNLLSGMKLDTSMMFNEPHIELTVNGQRPETKLFEAQKRMYISGYDQSKTKYNPRLYGFAQLGYGRPGLNVLSENFKGYTIIGIRGQWNIANLYLHQSEKEKNILQSNVEKINVQANAFDTQQKTKANVQELDIQYYNQLLVDDQQVIGLYEKILISSNAQFEQGISTINDYSNDANNLTQARIKRAIHTSLFNQAKELYNLIQGKK